MHCIALRRIALRHFASLCIALHSFAWLRVALHRFASLCISLRRFSLFCIVFHRFSSLSLAQAPYIIALHYCAASHRIASHRSAFTPAIHLAVVEYSPPPVLPDVRHVVPASSVLADVGDQSQQRVPKGSIRGP